MVRGNNMETIGDEGNGRNLPLFNSIKSTGTRAENFVVKKPKAAAGGSPGNPPKPPKNKDTDFVKKEQFPSPNKKRPPEDGFGSIVRNKR
jgi:hypothetical protein